MQNGTELPTAPLFHATSSRFFFPASGRRDHTTGGMALVSSYGYDWSASPHSVTFGYTLYSHSTNVAPGFNYLRAYGLPVRCLQAFTIVVRFFNLIPWN